MSPGGKPLQIDKVNHSALPPRRWKQKTMEFIVTRNGWLHHSSLAMLLSLSLGIRSLAQPSSAQPIPIGLDAYRAWDQWPHQRIGMRAYMRSTYDRPAGNEGADASHFLYQLSDDFNVTLDLEGPGSSLCSARYNHWHGSPWHYVVDGTDHVIQESSTGDPFHPVPDSTFLPAAPFPSPAE